jgi:hypothetical protein
MYIAAVSKVKYVTVITDINNSISEVATGA